MITTYNWIHLCHFLLNVEWFKKTYVSINIVAQNLPTTPFLFADLFKHFRSFFLHLHLMFLCRFMTGFGVLAYQNVAVIIAFGQACCTESGTPQARPTFDRFSVLVERNSVQNVFIAVFDNQTWWFGLRWSFCRWYRFVVFVSFGYPSFSEN